MMIRGLSEGILSACTRYHNFNILRKNTKKKFKVWWGAFSGENAYAPSTFLFTVTFNMQELGMMGKVCKPPRLYNSKGSSYE